jgi:hypothetical protein
MGLVESLGVLFQVNAKHNCCGARLHPRVMRPPGDDLRGKGCSVSGHTADIFVRYVLCLVVRLLLLWTELDDLTAVPRRGCTVPALATGHGRLAY